MAADLKSLREALGWTQERAAAETGTKIRTWGSWERGETEPPTDAVHKLLEVWLRNDAGGAVRVTIEGRVKAGAAEVQFGVNLGEVCVLPKSRDEPLYAVKVKGDSMAPDIQNNDVLVCRRLDDNDVIPGSIVIADLGSEEYVVKRFQRRQNRRLLESLKEGVEPITQPFRIHGKVIEIRRPLERH